MTRKEEIKELASALRTVMNPFRDYDLETEAEIMIDDGWHKQIEAEWTGILPRDYAHAEGIPSYATPEQRAAYHDMFLHIAHCSNCSTMFDNRDTKHWAYCPHCGAKIIAKGEII